MPHRKTRCGSRVCAPLSSISAMDDDKPVPAFAKATPSLRLKSSNCTHRRPRVGCVCKLETAAC